MIAVSRAPTITPSRGVFEKRQERLKGFGVFKGSHGVAHGVHTYHQQGKSNENAADVLFPAILCNHSHDYADKCEYGSKVFGLAQLNGDGVALQTREAQEPCGDCGSDVCAHYNGYRL